MRKDCVFLEMSIIFIVSWLFLFLRYELDELFWMLNFCEIEEIKERYVENSEFVVFFYGFLEEIMKKVKKKVVVMNFFFYF